MSPTCLAARGLVESRLVPAVNRFRTLQDRRGRVTAGHAEADALLAGLARDLFAVCDITGQNRFAGAFAEDAARWRAAGLDTPPDFSAVRDAYDPGADGAVTVLVAPVRTTNGPPPVGARLECCLALVDTPPACREFAAGLDCRFVRYVAGSHGYARGNCLVCFSEQVAAAVPEAKQRFALFLMNKFQHIYEQETLPVARRVFADRRWASDGLSPAACYSARCVWAAMHETYHQRGPRPLRDNLGVKLNWFCGLLEEVKVDARVVLGAARRALPEAEAVAEFVLFDRMIRYPRHPAATRNFDAGTGALMFERLADAGAIARRGDGRLTLDRARTYAALGELADAIERLEARSDDEYRAGAEAFVRSALPAGDCGQSFRFPDRYTAWVRPEPVRTFLSFDGIGY